MELQIKNIKKTYKDKIVLKKISLNIESGMVCGLLGVNGAGKSTLMKILFGLENPDDGVVPFDGKTQKQDAQMINKLGALIETPAIYMNLSAFDNLKTRALLYDIPDSEIQEILNLIGLSNTGKKKAGKFSLGMKQRLGLGMAIVTRPEFLILDEPTNGLDPDGIKELLALIIKLKNKGMTILVSSHQLHEVNQVADRIVILHNGEIHYNQKNNREENLEELFFKIVHGGF